MLSQLLSQFFAQSHLGKKKRARLMRVTAIPLIRAATVQPPVPRSEYKYIADP